MTIAEKKRSENIVEYLLFLWQMEDLARAAGFEEHALDDFILNSVTDDTSFEAEKNWVKALMVSMKNERVQQKGHVSEVSEIMTELTLLHMQLLSVIDDKKYQAVYSKAQPALQDFIKKSQVNASNEVEAALTALYGWLLLRRQGTEISEATQEAMQLFGQFLGNLAAQYKRMKAGEMNISLN
jgi:hypothetical protein